MSAAVTADRLQPAGLRALIAMVGHGLIEREEQARCLVLALLSGEHLLLVGPPGTAKSELARRLHRLAGGAYFERLLTRFSVPEELFGPLSLIALDEGRYEREVRGYLPTASVAFLDEVFKANSAILNALLGLLNERVFDQGAQRLAVPLVTLVAASNEPPDDPGLAAFHDRFLFRCPVPPVSDRAFGQLLAARASADGSPFGAPAPGHAAPSPLDLSALQALRERAAAVELPHAVVALRLALRGRLRAAAGRVSDRRWVRIVAVLRVAALANGRDAVAAADLCVLPWLVCERAEEHEPLREWLAASLGAGAEVDPQWLWRAAQAFERQLELESSATELAFDDSGKLALMRSVGGAEGSELGEGVPRLSAFSRRKRYSAGHIAARLAQIDQLLGEVERFTASALAHERWLGEQLAANLWVAPAFAQQVLAVLKANRERVVACQGALRDTRAAFAALPLGEGDDGRLPEPVPLDG